jgi:hypothetical protein
MFFFLKGTDIDLNPSTLMALIAKPSLLMSGVAQTVQKERIM